MNIFAQELEKILRTHGKDLSSLFSLRVLDLHSGSSRPIAPNKVVRLKRSLTLDMTATLNSEELEALQAWAPLNAEGQEVRRLRAALVAEGVHHLLAGRMPAEQAYHLGLLTLFALLDEEAHATTLWREAVWDQVRDFLDDALKEGISDTDEGQHGVVGGSPAALPVAHPEHEDSPRVRALEPVAESYETGMLWLAIALDTSEPGARLGYLALATSQLEHARELAVTPPSLAVDTPEQAEWLAVIHEALTEVDAWR